MWWMAGALASTDRGLYNEVVEHGNDSLLAFGLRVVIRHEFSRILCLVSDWTRLLITALRFTRWLDRCVKYYGKL